VHPIDAREVPMKRREILTLVGGAAAWPLTARAQQPAMPVIGYLNSAAPISPDALADLRKGLNETGYIEGRNVTIEFRPAEQYDQLPALAADLVRRRVAVIVAGALPAALAAKMATNMIPIVFFSGDDPVRAGLVTSLNRPSGNLTGVTNLTSVLLLKRFGLLRELVPTAHVVGVLVNPDNPNAERRLIDLQEGAHSIGQQVTVLNARREDDFATAFATAVRHGVGALLISDDLFFSSHRNSLAALAMRHALPTIYPSRRFVVAGGLVSYANIRGQTYTQIGVYVGRILKGEKPADLPVVQTTKFELVVNLKTAKALGLTVPDKLLALADEVIE
jgi:putative ABC transport system substrate-binding protein